jgi:hypothetical protein
MKKLLAPNGKPSNLTPEQYKLVRTPAFKAWFGDWENNPKTASKVVDENGEPLVVYHATNNKFWEFSKEKQVVGYYGKGFYFTQDLKEAKDYGKRVIRAFLNIKSIFELSDETPQELLNELAEANVDVVDMGEDNDIEQRSKYTFGYASQNSDIFMNNLIKNGYYGIRMIYDLESKTYFIAFEPNQIKLADGSNTTFDNNNPDIRYEDGGLIDDIFVEDMYSVVIDGDSYHDIIYDGKDYDYALYRYNSIEPNDFLYPNGSHNHKLLMKYFIKYKFVGEIEDGDKISDYIDYLNDSDYWEVIEKSEWEELISDDVAAVNKSTDEIIGEIRDFINSKYVHLRYGSKYMNIYVYDDEDDEIDYITIRVADHSQNPRNRTHEHHISFVIANKNETKDRFRSRDEYYYDDDDDIEGIKSEIESIIDEKIEEIKQERYEQGGNTQKIVGLNYKDGEEDIYSDEYVNGVIRIVDSDVEILDWNSKYKKIGGTEISLQRLRNAYKGEIRAVDVGYEGENSYSYWQKMMSKSLIDGFYDDDANYISRYEQGGILNNLFIYNIGGL